MYYKSKKTVVGHTKEDKIVKSNLVVCIVSLIMDLDTLTASFNSGIHVLQNISFWGKRL